MYPGTIVNIIDESAMQEPQETVADNSPLYLAVSSFDRGPEDLRVVSTVKDFQNLYGSTMNFAKHGQPAIQAANDIAGGARLLIKRLVPDDALLGNVILSVTPTVTIKARKAAENEDGVTLSYLQTGDTEDASSDEDLYVVEDRSVVLKWESTSVTNCKKAKDVLSSITTEQPTVTTTQTKAVTPATVDETTTQVVPTDGGVTPVAEPTDAEAAQDEVTIVKKGKFYLFVITDNGRSSAIKSVKINADYNLSRNLSDMIYDLVVYYGTTRLESTTATLNPDVVYNGSLYGFNEDTSEQVKFYNIDGEFDKYVDFLASALGTTPETVRSYDLIMGRDSRSAAIRGVTVDPESINIGSTYGVEIPNGSDGAFAETAFGTKEWTDKAVEVFNGTFDDSIWDVDTYKISAVWDANYPDAVKTAIADLVNFREDCFYFRDYGVDLYSYAAIITYYNGILPEYKNKFIADYFTTYDIFDPETKKRIRVTMLYDMSRAAISIFADGAYRPMAGIINNMVLTNAIRGSINFAPKITPAANQKSLLDDAKINYATFSEGQCIVQSAYTSQQGVMTQLSYINNVLAIQEVARAVRTACPKFRYTFVSGTDFQTYREAVNNVLQGYRSNFASLDLVYTLNALESMHKIFHASLSFKFGNWAQTEIFDLYALGNDD